MKPVSFDVPSRDLGRPSLRPLVAKLIERLESIERRLAPDGQPPPSFSAERALLERLEGRGDAITLERQRVLHRALDEVYFSIVLAPGYHGEGPALDVSTEFRGFILPAGALTPIHAHLPLRAHWPLTRARITVWAWTPGGVPGTFTLRLNIAQTAGGVAVGAPTYTVFNHDFTISPTSNVTEKVVSNAPATAVLKTSPGELVKVYVARLNDGNANPLHLQCALIEFLEVA